MDITGKIQVKREITPSTKQSDQPGITINESPCGNKQSYSFQQVGGFVLESFIKRNVR
jgi:hypothetical protein